MDWQTVFNLLGTGVLGLVGWFIKDTKDDLKSITGALADFRVKVAEDYVTHNDLTDIKDSLRRIEDKLDGKADK